MENEHDVLNDILTMIDGQHGCVMGQMDAYVDGNDVGHVTVRTVDGNVVSFAVTRVCDVCDETGDATCFDGSGICATENEHDKPRHLAITLYGQCTTCGAQTDNMERDKWITNDDYTMFQCPQCATENERTFKSIDDVSRYVNGYRACYVGDGACAPFNRDVLRGWLCELNLTDAQINTFFDGHGI